MVGLNAGDGVNFKKFNYSLTDNVVEVLNDTNMRDCNLKGQYVYQIDTVAIFNDQNCKDPTIPSFGLCTPSKCMCSVLHLTSSVNFFHKSGLQTH